jgi:hypothetical protein
MSVGGGAPAGAQAPAKGGLPIAIRWVAHLPGDFSFRHQWSFPPGVEAKADGRAGCADGGFCPERCQAMLDPNGVVRPNSAQVFYQLLDTTHRFHTTQGQAWCYEWAGTDFIEVWRLGPNSVACATATNEATHCSLQLQITKGVCRANIVLRSIAQGGDATYLGRDGTIYIDQKLWQKGILKASFRFDFSHPENPRQPMYWHGKIYALIVPAR